MRWRGFDLAVLGCRGCGGDATEQLRSRRADLAKQQTPAKGRRLGNPAAVMMTVRKLHLYLGLFIAPSVMFFAATGSLQLFSLHEDHAGYEAPPLFKKLGALHKDQVFALPKHNDHGPALSGGGGKAGAAPAKPQDDADPPTPIKVVALKWLFLAVALGLIASTLLGIWMALTIGRRKVVSLLVLAAGVALPLALVAM
jgi:hypothetical protein